MNRNCISNVVVNIIIYLSGGLLFAQELPNIAVLELEGKNITLEDASVLSDKLRGELIGTGAFQVIERGMMDQVLKEQGFQQSGCTSDECAVEIGQLMGVSQMIAGSIGRIEEIYLVSIRLIDVASGKIVKMVQKDIQGSLTDVMREGIPQCAFELAGISPAVVDSPTVIQTDTPPVRSDKKPEKKDGIHIKPRFSLSAGYTMAHGWYNRGQELENTTGAVVASEEYFHGVPTHGGTIAAGIKMKRSRLNLECTFTRGKWEDIKDETSSNFSSMTITTVGSKLVWYLEIWRIADFITIAPAIGVGFWKTTDNFESDSGIQAKTDLESYQFGILLLRIKLGPDRIGWFIDIGEIIGTQPEMTLQNSVENSRFNFYRIPPIMQVRIGVEFTF